MQNLINEVRNCNRCAIEDQTKNKTIGKGSMNPRVLFVGLNPGKEENETGVPFIGRAGKLLDKWIQYLGLDNSNCTVINAIKCYTPNQSSLSRDEIENCYPYLEKQIQLLKPEYIVALGDIVYKKMTGSSLPISEAEGNFFENIFVMKHPSYYLRKGGYGWERGIEPLKNILNPPKDKQRYTSLHCHSEYSIGDGAGELEDLVKYAKEQGFTSMAITDHGTIAGWYEFQKLCDKYEIKPLLGIEFYVANNYEDKTRQRYHIVVLAKDQDGIKNIFKLNTIANREGFYVKPRILLDQLYEHKEGLVVSSACTLGVISQRLLQGEIEEAENLMKRLHSTFKEDFYLELQPHYFPDQITINPVIMDMVEREGVEPVITCDVHFRKREDKSLQNAVRAIAYKQKYGTSTLTGDSYCLISTEELREYALKTNITEEIFDRAIENTMKIAEKCNGRLPKYKSVMPKFEIPEEYFNEQ